MMLPMKYLMEKEIIVLRERKDKDRSIFIVKDIINVYPDTLAWIHDFTYSFNEPMTQHVFLASGL